MKDIYICFLKFFYFDLKYLFLLVFSKIALSFGLIINVYRHRLNVCVGSAESKNKATYLNAACYGANLFNN